MSDEDTSLEELGFEVPTEHVKDMPLGEIKHAGCVTSFEVPKEWADRHAMEWAQEAIRFVSNAAYRKSILEPRRVEERDSLFEVWETDGLTKREIEALVEQRVLRKGKTTETGQQEQYLSRVKLFKTPKPAEPPNPAVARLIFDCREANAACNAVEWFALPSLNDVVTRMRKLGKAKYLVCDLATWFYEIPADEEFSRTMCILFEGERYFPRVLSMGHQASPYAAHHLAKVMAFMTKEDSDLLTLGVDRRELKENPTIVTLYDSNGEEVGFATVYIDNIIVAVADGCEDKMLLRKWETRLRSNARALRKAEFKYMKLVQDVVEYLGVQYEWNEEDQAVQWRWSETKRREWIKENSGPIRSMKWSSRKVASWGGTLVWKTRIAGSLLYTIEEQLEAVKKATGHAKGTHWDSVKQKTVKNNWDTVIEDVDTTIGWEVLEEMRRLIIGEEFTRDEDYGPEGVFNRGKWRPTEEPNVWVAVDASTSLGRGVVWYNMTGQPIRFRGDNGRMTTAMYIENTEEEKGDYAFILETRVVLEMLKATDLRWKATAEGTARRTVVRCASDCVGAIVCILKGYSRNTRACAIIREIHELLAKFDAVLEMRWVPGTSMVADQASRKEGLEEERIRATWEGLRTTTIQLPKPKARGDTTDIEFQ